MGDRKKETEEAAAPDSGVREEVAIEIDVHDESVKAD